MSTRACEEAAAHAPRTHARASGAILLVLPNGRPDASTPARAQLPDAEVLEGGARPAAGRRRAAVRSCLAAVRRPLARGLNMTTRNVYIAGAELGAWAFTANAIMVRRAPGRSAPRAPGIDR